MNKGFTLMEVLAVMLILAVIAAFAVPSIRSIRADIRHRRAKTALVLFQEALDQIARRSGKEILENDSFTPNANILETRTCDMLSNTGIPVKRGGVGFVLTTRSIYNLFGCGYLNPKDFQGLPYTFKNATTGVKMKGETGAGKKYEGKCYTIKGTCSSF